MSSTTATRKIPPILPLMVPIMLLSILAAGLLGTTQLDPSNIFDASTIDYHIFWNLRLSRALVAFLAGSGLALSGMVFQALFLNPLATPFTLGVAGGASCGAALVIFLSGLPGLYIGPGVTFGAMAGAAAALLLVLAFTRTRMGHQRHVMLLAGVAISFFFSSLLLLIQSLSSFSQSFQIVRWLMGGIAVAGYREVLYMLPVLLFGTIVILFHGVHLNLLLLGDDLAGARGLNVQRTKRILLVVVSLMVATIVSVTGPIGFVGMVVPHLCRIIWGGNHRYLAPVSLFAGGILLVLCDLIARMVLAPSGIPVGVVTSLTGAPFFFMMLLRRQYRF